MSGDRMQTYSERINKLLLNSNFQYDSSVNKIKNKKVILYGAGEGYVTFAVFILRRFGIMPSLILDKKFKDETEFDGIKARSIIDFWPTEDDLKSSIVIITVGKTEYHEEIIHAIKDKGFINIILSTDIYEYHLLCPQKELLDNRDEYFTDNSEKIIKCAGLLEDELSYEIFEKVLATHLTGKPLKIPNRPLDEQYFPKDILTAKSYSKVINCGAYDGNTVKQIVRYYGKMKAIVCFEPDASNYSALTNYLVKESAQIADFIAAIPCGVYSKNKKLKFSSDDKFNSMISEEGDTIIEGVAIDVCLPDFKPTLITIDVEGAEFEAVKGMRKTIRESAPDIAVCVYHAPNHLWDIPLFLHELNPSYRFFLRNYTSFISETVLYATAAHSEVL